MAEAEKKSNESEKKVDDLIKSKNFNFQLLQNTKIIDLQVIIIIIIMFLKNLF